MSLPLLEVDWVAEPTFITLPGQQFGGIPVRGRIICSQGDTASPARHMVLVYRRSLSLTYHDLPLEALAASSCSTQCWN